VAAFKDHKKDPDATLDWIFDWTLWLGEFEVITDAEFIVDPGLIVNFTSHTTKTATVWLAGGSESQVYNVTCRITSSDGRIDDRSFTLRCTQR
jgi:hypothetical protein